ncbi:MAG: hypothetical protein ACO1TE_15325 [Prosthecobacter sp.]
MKKLARIACFFMAVLLLGMWCWFCEGISDVALDYPLRLAGQQASYPPFDTAAFYLNCVRALAEVFIVSSFAWAVPLMLTLALLFAGLRMRSWRRQALVSLVILIVPVTSFAAHSIYQSRNWHMSSSAAR